MTKPLKRANFYILLVAGLLLASLGLQFGARAATGSLYLSPSSVSVQKGKSFSVSVVLNPGGVKADTANVVVSYPSSLKYTGHSVRSPFGEITGVYSSTSGKVKFVANILGGGYITKATTVATLSFTAEVSSGSANISLSGSGAAYAGNAINPSLGGATVKFSAPPAPAPAPVQQPTQTTAPSTTTSNETTTQTDPTSTEDSLVPSTKIADVSPSFTKVELSVNSTAPTSVYVKYSSDGQNYLSTKASKFATSHQLDLAGLIPGATYYYQVISKNKTGQTTKSDIGTIKTKGLTVTIEVQDQNYQPLANKKVSLHSTPQTTETNSDGLATFSNVVPGDHTISYTTGGQTYSEKLAITNNVQLSTAGSESSAVQKLFVVLPFGQGSSGNALLWVIIAVIALLIVTTGVVMIRRRAKQPRGVGVVQNQPVRVLSTDVPTDSTSGSSVGTPAIKPAEPVKPNLVDPMSAAPSVRPGSTITPTASQFQNVQNAQSVGSVSTFTRPDESKNFGSLPQDGPENNQGG